MSVFYKRGFTQQFLNDGGKKAPKKRHLPSKMQVEPHSQDWIPCGIPQYEVTTRSYGENSYVHPAKNSSQRQSTSYMRNLILGYLHPVAINCQYSNCTTCCVSLNYVLGCKY